MRATAPRPRWREAAARAGDTLYQNVGMYLSHARARAPGGSQASYGRAQPPPARSPAWGTGLGTALLNCFGPTTFEVRLRFAEPMAAGTVNRVLILYVCMYMCVCVCVCVCAPIYPSMRRAPAVSATLHRCAPLFPHAHASKSANGVDPQLTHTLTHRKHICASAPATASAAAAAPASCRHAPTPSCSRRALAARLRRGGGSCVSRVRATPIRHRHGAKSIRPRYRQSPSAHTRTLVTRRAARRRTHETAMNETRGWRRRAAGRGPM
jgi:hypothetical protein